MKKFFSCLIIAILILINLPAIPEETTEKSEFITWYEIYYEAQEFFGNGKWRDAIDDYHLVLVKQPKDRRNAKTYGMNFIREFTPNRDLGIAYYQIGEFELAKQYLEISLKQLPTDLCKEYFEKVRIELQKDIVVDEHFKKGITHFEKKEYELSIKEMQEVLKIRPDNDVARKYIERAKSIIEIKNKIKTKK